MKSMGTNSHMNIIANFFNQKIKAHRYVLTTLLVIAVTVFITDAKSQTDLNVAYGIIWQFALFLSIIAAINPPKLRNPGLIILYVGSATIVISAINLRAILILLPITFYTAFYLDKIFFYKGGVSTS